MNKEKILSAETFGRGLQMINSLSKEDNQIEEDTEVNLYYMLLGEFTNEDYLNGVILLLKEEELHYGTPSPATIIKYINKAMGSNSEAMDVLGYVRRDITMYGDKKPRYQDNVEAAIEAAGGWNKLRAATEYDTKNIEKAFKEAFKPISNEEKALINDKKMLLSKK